MSRVLYPSINLRSKNEIAKRISSKNLNQKSALILLTDVLQNFDKYWYDSKRSDPTKGKFVRSAAKSPKLDKVLDLINTKILKPHDNLVPNFIFGGLTGRNNIEATGSLLGKKRNRVLIKLDIMSFFEQISQKRVFYFFHTHCGCSVEASRVLSRLCCVPKGKQHSGSTDIILARGFSTSSRLAMWCNLTTFQRLEWKIKKILKRYDPKIAIYVDDIGITASNVSIDDMETVKLKIVEILENFDHNQRLPVHPDGEKSFVKSFHKGAEHLGIKFGRNKLSLGRKSRSKIDKARSALKTATDSEAKRDILRSYKARERYKRQVETFNIKT